MEFRVFPDHRVRALQPPSTERLLQHAGDLPGRRIGIEHEVARLQVGAHVLEPEPGAQVAQVGHGHAVVPPDVDCAKECAVPHGASVPALSSARERLPRLGALRPVAGCIGTTGHSDREVRPGNISPWGMPLRPPGRSSAPHAVHRSGPMPTAQRPNAATAPPALTPSGRGARWRGGAGGRPLRYSADVQDEPEGIHNFRAVAPYPLRDGGTLRPRRVFRSGALELMTSADEALLSRDLL